MASCIELTTNLKKEVVDAFMDYLKNPYENSWFVAFGNPISWSVVEEGVLQSGFVYSSNLVGDDNAVPLPRDTDEEKYEFYRTCTAMKKISRDDVSFLIPRNEWQQNKTYFPYRYDQNMFEDLSRMFYVFNSDNRCIYKCIENNSGLSGGAFSASGPASINKPSSTGLEVFDTGDGYKWKLIYQINSSDLLNYTVEGRTEEDSYIPVRYIDFEPDPSETELLKHKSIQDNAVPGSISSIYLNELYRGLYTFDSRYSVVGTDDAIYPISGVSAGATSITIDYFGTNTATNSLRNMLFYVISGPGDGQTRVIKSSSRTKIGGSQYLTIEVDPLDEGLSAYSATESRSAINILPSLKILGDGEARSPTASGNSNLESALGLVTFSSSGATAFLTGVDLIDIGKNYTYARAFSPKGLTAVNTGDPIPDDLFLISLSPPNGHGSNAVLELGASKILIKTTFEGTEEGRIEAVNDFRQIALIKNPSLRDRIALVRTIDGVGSGISAGDSVTLTGSSATLDGTVLRSTAFDDNPGYEYLVNGLSGSIGDFDYISGVAIDPNDGFELIDVAGLENKETVVLEATTTVSSVESRDIVVGVGNKSIGLRPSYASGKVIRVDASDVYVSPIRGNFKENEIVYAIDRDGTYSSSFTVQDIRVPTYQNFRDSYSMVTELTLQSQANELFESSTFQQDQLIYAFEDDTVSKITSSTEYKSNAFCFDWEANLGPVLSLPGDPAYNTGTLKLVGSRPDKFEVGDYILYYKKSGIPLYAQINNITKPEISYGSGEVLYVQNFPSIERNYQTDEEINLIVGI
jgi:hypothetical protein